MCKSINAHSIVRRVKEKKTLQIHAMMDMHTGSRYCIVVAFSICTKVIRTRMPGHITDGHAYLGIDVLAIVYM